MGSATRKQLAQPSDVDVHAFIDSSEILVEDVLRGLWDGAVIDEIVVDYRFPFHAPLHFAQYIVVATEINGGQIKMQIKSSSAILGNPVGENWGTTCRVPVFSQSSGVRAGCNLDVDSWTLIVPTSAYSADLRIIDFNFTGITWTAGVNWGKDGWAAYGTLEFLSGTNSGVRRMIKTWTPNVPGNTSRAVLEEPLPYAYSSGELIRLLPGCTKLLLGDGGCVTKFNNALNFQGEPHIPGRDAASEVVT